MGDACWVEESCEGCEEVDVNMLGREVLLWDATEYDSVSDDVAQGQAQQTEVQFEFFEVAIGKKSCSYCYMNIPPYLLEDLRLIVVVTRCNCRFK